MEDEEKYDQIVAQLYEAALAPKLWHPAVLDASAWVGADAFHLFAWDAAAQQARLNLVSAPHFSRAMQQFDSHFAKLDVVRERALSVAPGAFFVTQEHFDQRFVDRSPWFQEFMIPNGMCWSTGGTVPIEQGVATILALLRAHDRGAYSSDELHRAKRIWTHFKRATSISIQTEELRRRAALGEASLDRMEIGILSTGPDGTVRYANRNGLALVEQSRALHMRGGRVCGITPAAAGLLERAIADATASRRATSFALGGPSPAESDTLVTVCPVAETSSFWNMILQPTALVLLRRPDHQRMLSVRQLMQLFRLSPAEARLARALAQGATPEEYAVAEEVSTATVRTQLRKIFGKTGTARQAELVRLLVGIPPIRD